MIKRPLEIFLVGMIIGILIGLYCKNSIVLFFILLFICLCEILIIHVISIKYKRYIKVYNIKKVFIIFLIPIVVFSIAIIQKEKQYYKTQRQMLDNREFLVTIISNPTKKEYMLEYKAKVKKVGENKTNCIVLLQTKTNQIFSYGDQILIIGEYKTPSKARNDKGFDYQDYLKSIRSTR